MATIHFHPDHACNLTPAAQAIVRRMIATGVESRVVEGITFTVHPQPLGWYAVILENGDPATAPTAG